MCTTTHLMCTKKCTQNMHRGAHQKVLYHMSSYAHLTYAQADVRNHQVALMTCSCMLLDLLFSTAHFPPKALIKHRRKRRGSVQQSNKDKLKEDANTIDSNFATISFIDIYRIQCNALLPLRLVRVICVFNFSNMPLKSH